MVEATRLAYAARDQFVADMALSDVPVSYLLSDRLAEELARRIDPAKAVGKMPELSGVEHSDTVYIATVDKDRNAVSFINSIFHPYGAGLMAPKSGVLFHNRGQSFVVEDGHRNAIAPRKRPMHTIIPGMVVEDGRPTLSFGVMGGHYQAMGHAWLLSLLFDHGLDLQAAMDLPRLFPLPGSNAVEAEASVRAIVEAEFVKRGLKLQPPLRPIGGAQAIRIDWARNVLIGASDHRKDGFALGY
jgi:gamma-glutamyltranspeptidase/glutathione hydrolase